MNLILFEEAEASRPLSPGDERTVHLIKVLRKQPGDRFCAGILGGRLGTGDITRIGPGGIEFTLSLTEAPPPRTPLRLVVGFPRPIQLRRLLRDCASLGLAAVDLAGTDLGEKSYCRTKLLDDGGARAALIEGAVQARDTQLPELAVYPDIAAWLEARPWTAEQSESGPLLAAADNVRPGGTFTGLGPVTGPAVLAVGPERGWSGRERAMLEAAGFARLSMGRRALRTETACTAGAVLLMGKMGLLD
ncbi:MAG: 16S rRNA (uracil(1498)-N(3))-methyltransferase [Treponema sp.]|nr:16S rRNA (uracil(1498)-N(3))-methyltransferase [Treponema sp.]